MTDGDYKLSMFSRSSLDDNAWKPCVGADHTYIKMHVSGGKATISNGGSREVELLSCDMKKQFGKGEDATFTLRYKVTKGSYEDAIFFLMGAPVVADENGDFFLDNTKKECMSMPPAIVTAKEGEEFTITGVLAADGLDVGRYTLLIANPAEFLITGHDFEVVESGTDGIDAPALQEVAQDSDVWYDLQGRRYKGKPSVPGIYVNNGKKVLLK